MTTRLESLEEVARLAATNDNPQLRAMAEQALAHADPPGQVAQDVALVADAMGLRTEPTRIALYRLVALSRLAAGAQEAEALRARVEALEAFKAYVHKRLDDAGVPTHPNGPHSAQGCRIGDRLDLTLATASKASAMEAQLAGLQEQQDELVSVLGVHPEGETLAEAARLVVAEIDTLKSRCDVLRERATTAEAEMARYRADVVTLKAGMEPTRLESPDPQSLNDALSSLRLWRGAARRVTAERDDARAEVDRLTGVYRDEQRLHRQALEEANRLARQLEGVRARCVDEQRHISILEENVGLGGGAGLRAVAAWIRDGDASASTAKRYPCSPTCTHAAASSPEHPQKVLRLSAEFSKTMDVPLAGGCACAGEGVCQWCEEKSKEEEMSAAYERGAEAMRAACSEAVQGQLQACGIYKDSPMWQVIHAAIEGATA